MATKLAYARFDGLASAFLTDASIESLLLPGAGAGVGLQPLVGCSLRLPDSRLRLRRAYGFPQRLAVELGA